MDGATTERTRDERVLLSILFVLLAFPILGVALAVEVYIRLRHFKPRARLVVARVGVKAFLENAEAARIPFWMALNNIRYEHAHLLPASPQYLWIRG